MKFINNCKKNTFKMGEPMTSRDIRDIIEEADLNNDGKLDYREVCFKRIKLFNKKNRIIEGI